MQKAEPTLSAGGWLTDPSSRLAKAFVYFMTSEYDQTNDFKGEIVSIPYIITLHGKDPVNCASRIQQDMRRSLERRFDKASVEVEAVSEPDEISYVLSIDVIVEQDGKKYSMGQSIGVDRQTLTARLMAETNR